MESIARKTCTKCRDEKPVTDFGKMTASRDGYHHWCKKCINTHRSEYYQNNRDITLAKAAARRKEEPEKFRAYRKANKSQRDAYNKRYRQDNPDIVLAAIHRRRARRLGNGGTYSRAEWNELKALCEYRCLLCMHSEPDVKLTIDHIVPLSRGGTSNIGNIQPLCFACNMRKGTESTDYRPLHIVTYYDSHELPTAVRRQVYTELRRQAAAQRAAKVYDGLIGPDGTIYAPITNMLAFCEEHSISYHQIYRVARGQCSQHRGWKCYIPKDQ